MYRYKYLKYKIKYFLEFNNEKFNNDEINKLMCNSVSKENDDNNIMNLQFSEFIGMIEEILIKFIKELYTIKIKLKYKKYELNPEYKKKTLTMIDKKTLFIELDNVFKYTISNLLNIKFKNISKKFNISSSNNSIEDLTEDDILEIFTNIIKKLEIYS